MNPITILAALAAGSVSQGAFEPRPVMSFRLARLPVSPISFFRPRASGIPTPPRLNQRQKRKANRRAFPHGFNGRAA